MLTNPIDLSKIDASQIFDHLYSIFHADFVAHRTFLASSIYIDPCSHKKDEDKELAFWHLATRENKKKVWENGRHHYTSIGRFLDLTRGSRLPWVKTILTQHDHEAIKVFYHRETNKKRSLRLYLWAAEFDFVVILQQLGASSAVLVTSFYVDNCKKRKEFEKRHYNYVNNVNNLLAERWF